MIQVRVCAHVRKWVSSQPSDFGRDVLAAMRVFFDSQQRTATPGTRSSIALVLRSIPESVIFNVFNTISHSFLSPAFSFFF